MTKWPREMLVTTSHVNIQASSAPFQTPLSDCNSRSVFKSYGLFDSHGNDGIVSDGKAPEPQGPISPNSVSYQSIGAIV